MTTLAVTNPLAPETLPMLLQVMLMAALVNVACALVGSFLVLRRLSMMGDALAHAVLPGLVLAFVFSGSMSILPLFVGAVLAGLATTFLTETLHQYGRVATDASMGVVFTSLFALGVVLLKLFASDVHFDTACVYEGSLLWLVLDTVPIAGLAIPRQALVVLPIVLLNALVLGLLWKELKVTTFDAALATSMGISAAAMHYLLMALVAVTAVASFQVVGSILVVAMLIVPPAAAQLCVERLHHLVWLACGMGLVVAVGGSVLAVAYDVSPPGTMAVLAGGLYVLAAVFSPTGGVVARAWAHHQTATRIVGEDLLAMLYRVEEHDPHHRLAVADSLDAVGGGWRARGALGRLLGEGVVARDGNHLVLTDEGRSKAARLVRSHRLWESYLVEELGLPLDHVHEPAHRVEHFLDEQIRQQLAERLPDAGADPHGREIPD